MKREELLQLYREEKDPNVKDRLMLNIKVRFEDVSITKAARSLGKGHFLGQQVVQPLRKGGRGGTAEPAQIRKAAEDHKGGSGEDTEGDGQ